MAIEKCPTKVLTINAESFARNATHWLEVRMSLASSVKKNFLRAYGSVVL